MIGTTLIHTRLRRFSAATTWRPSLRVAVGALSVAVVIAMAIVLAEATAGHLRTSATDGAVHGLEAIVRGYVDPQIDEASLSLDAPPDPGIGEELDRLTASGDVRVMSIFSRDGRVVYSTEAELRGRRFSIGSQLSQAFLGTSTASYGQHTGHEFHGEGASTSEMLEIFVPIRGMVDGSPIGVFVAQQDARPIEASVQAIRQDVFVLALMASLVLLVVLALAFGATSALLGRQNRMLRQRAEKERVLMDDLRHNEERFRSLVRNSADIILIVRADGTIVYESPAVARVLGYNPQERLGESVFAVIHPGDVTWVRAMFGDLTRTSDAETNADFRVHHSDGTLRWIEATVKNLLDDPAVGGIVVNYRDITERRSLEEQLRYQAFHDALTALANRALFMDRLEHALARARRDQSSLAVLFLDLDDFKAVNDRLGHAAGDTLLLATAERLGRVLRDADTAARMGGDEFAVLLEDAQDAEAATQIAQRVLEVLRAPFEIQGNDVRISGSIGIAMYESPEHTGDELLRHADVAMYAAKTQGKDRLTVFEPNVHLATIDRHQLRADLHMALERSEFSLVYQPVFELQDMKVRGFEALLRWMHPQRGPITPTEFIPIAEETGLIVPIGRWVLREACLRAASWSGEGSSPLTMSVNLSARQLDDDGLVDDVRSALREANLDPGLVTLEITESVLLRDVDDVVARLSALKRIGVRLAIDDFGTGYSSLSYLRRLPVDALKIDRSFVAGVDGGSAEGALVRSIVSLGQILGLETIAEGIEETNQLTMLRSFGAELGQGFLFAEPLDAAMVPDVIRSGVATRPETNGRRRTEKRGERRSRGPVVRSQPPEPITTQEVR